MKLFQRSNKQRPAAKGFQASAKSNPATSFILEPILTPTVGIDGVDGTPEMAIAYLPQPTQLPDVDLPDLNDTTLTIPHTDYSFDIEPADETIEPDPWINTLPHNIPFDRYPEFDSGVFSVGSSGQVEIDFLFDGGGFQGELAMFSLADMEQFEPGSPEFIQEAARRALSDSKLGHVVISDATDAAWFSREFAWEGDFNTGEYQGTKYASMRPGDKIGFMLVPNGTVQSVLEHPNCAWENRPLFSMATANPNDAFQVGQIADVTGNGSIFAFEDLRMDGHSDRDYNDVVFHIQGATGEAVHLDDVIASDRDWRQTEIGQVLIDYPVAYVDEPSHQPLIGIIDTGFSYDNPDIDYSRIGLGHDWIDRDENPLLQSGQGNEHGTQVLGIISATQNNDVGIDGVNDQAPIWLGRATGSGQWANSLIEFVDAAKDSGQANAVVNLSLDLTQLNSDGSTTTRTELTLAERAALEYAQQNHVLVVVSAGNQGGEMSALGKASLEFDNVITVGAVNSELTSRADYSSYGAGLDILAPGGSTEAPVVSLHGNGTGTSFGTSIATAHVTGIASQLWATNPDLSYQQVKEILKATATELGQSGWDTETGAGLLNAALAVQMAAVITPFSRSIPPSIEIPDLKTPILGSSWADDSVTYLSTSSGQILRINSGSGTVEPVYQGHAFTDIALSPSGLLYGSTFDRLFEIDPSTGQERLIGEFPTDLSINALTFSPDGKLYAADGDTGNLFWIDPRSTQVFQIGSLGTGSSGDIVFNGEYEILAIVRGEIRDRLMAIDISTGQARTIGDLGFQDVLGLALTNGVLSAYTSSGQKLVIDPQTGIASVQATVAGITGQIWGAADNPSRSGIVVGELPQIPQTGELPDPEPIPQERQTTPLYLDQTYRFQTADRASGDAIGSVPWWQVFDRPSQNVVNAFRWAYSERHSDNGVPRMGAPSGPIRLQTLAGQRVWVQEFATGGSFNSRGLIVMRESDSNSTDYNRTAIALFGEPLGWRVDLMGLPRSNPIPATRSPQGTEGWYIPFEYGSQHWTRQNFANKSIWRDYQAEYDRLGGSSGWLGFPTYDPEAYSPPNTYGQRWEIARFEGGVIIWGSAVGAFSFSWQDVNSNSGKWRQFWNAIAQGRSRDEIRTLLDNPYSVFRENTNSNTGWATNVYRWDRNQGQPPANFWDNTANFLATINLGSNVRNDGKKGINLQDWRDGSPRGDRLPSDFFVMRSYTSAYFEAGKRYRAMVRADDGYQLFAKKQDNQRWFHFTPENQWQTDAYGAYKEVVFDVPETGWYDFHFHHYEGGGNAYFDLYWEEIGKEVEAKASLKRYGDLSAEEKRQVDVYPAPSMKYAALSNANPKQWSGKDRAFYLQDSDMPVVADPRYRSSEQIINVINYLNVGDSKNKRFWRDTATYCNIFAVDVMRALRAPLPHWLNKNEINANATFTWLSDSKNGWKAVSPSDAARAAKQGIPGVAVWKNPTGSSGHIAVIRPDTPDNRLDNPQIAQAGWVNYVSTDVETGFGTDNSQLKAKRPIKYFIYDQFQQYQAS